MDEGGDGSPSLDRKDSRPSYTRLSRIFSPADFWVRIVTIHREEQLVSIDLSRNAIIPPRDATVDSRRLHRRTDLVEKVSRTIARCSVRPERFPVRRNCMPPPRATTRQERG